MSLKIIRKVNFQTKAKTTLANVEKAMNTAMSVAALDIVTRTTEGRDAEGSAFDPYSDQYLEYRRKKGRSDNVNLQFTGQMLASIRHKVDSDGTITKGSIYFGDEVNRKKARYIQEKRRFFALSREQVAGIIKLIRERLGDK
jgi:hypothetical protein